jgi:hypothetical protein
VASRVGGQEGICITPNFDAMIDVCFLFTMLK